MDRTPLPAAVLFDMDGTLLDSERIWDVALDELAARLGGRLSAQARSDMVGSSVGRSVAIVHEDLGVDAEAAASGEFLLQRAFELFGTSLEWRPGAQELLVAVHAAGIPTGLVTSTHRALTEVALDTIGREYLDVVVCGDEVPRPKPTADPYLQAARLLGVDPTRSLAIEDSVLGVTSAEAAGCAVLAVPSDVPMQPEPRRTVRESLVGLTVADLAAYVPD